jgi:nucleoside-diphosphate-sugar epimerase
MLDVILKELSHNKILVTGANGFIGSRLVQVLVNNPKIQVSALVHNYSHSMRIARYNIDIIQGDVLDKDQILELVNNYDIVYHCAYANKGTRKKQRQINVLGTRNILEACIENNIGKLIYVSTMVVYGNALDSVITEDLQYRYSKDTYADTKIDAEKLVMKYIMEKALKAVIVQPSVVYGPWAPSFIKYPISIMTSGIKILPGDGKGICNALYIDDLVQALLLSAITQKALGERFLISGKDTPTWKDYFGYLNSYFNSDRVVYKSLDEIKSLISINNKNNRTFRQIFNVFKKKEVFDFIKQLTIVKYLYANAREILSEKQLHKLKAKMQNSSERQNHNKESNKINSNLFIEKYSEYIILAAKGKVCINKAEKILGYTPIYSLKDGMNKTADWIKWSNIIRSET